MLRSAVAQEGVAEVGGVAQMGQRIDSHMEAVMQVWLKGRQKGAEGAKKGKKGQKRAEPGRKGWMPVWGGTVNPGWA